MEISDFQLDTLKEIINIGVGKSASSFNKILDKKVSLQVPVIDVITYDKVKFKVGNHLKNKLSIVKMEFDGDLTGLCELVFPVEGAVEIVRILTNESSLSNGLNDQLKTNTLSEIGNMILNALIGTLGNLLKTRIRYSIPKYFECISEEIINDINPINKHVIYAETLFKIVNEDISGSFILFLEVDSFDKLLGMLSNYVNNYSA